MYKNIFILTVLSQLHTSVNRVFVYNSKPCVTILKDTPTTDEFNKVNITWAHRYIIVFGSYSWYLCILKHSHQKNIYGCTRPRQISVSGVRHEPCMISLRLQAWPFTKWVECFKCGTLAPKSVKISLSQWSSCLQLNIHKPDFCQGAL